ncbi:MAG TPA: OsmC family protein, partial [Verrucomicrobiaceae bacterium]
MVEITSDYKGQLRCVAVHGPSENQLITDAPADNMGKGEAFSPTDLVATALATCMLTTIGIVAQRKGLTVPGMRARIEKHMSADAPRRIVRLPVQLWISLPADHPERALLERTAETCP